MNVHDLEECKRITEYLKKRPLNSFFLEPNYDQLPDYTAIVARPIDYSAITDKLDKNMYKNAYEWYGDISLIYKNALQYHPTDSFVALIAEAAYSEFKKKAGCMGCKTQQEWFNKMIKHYKKLIQITAQSPVPQGIDPLIPSIISRASQQPPPNPKNVAEAIDHIRRSCSDPEVRYNIIAILKGTQKDFKVESDNVLIDAEKLSDDALKALLLYSQTLIQNE